MTTEADLQGIRALLALWETTDLRRITSVWALWDGVVTEIVLTIVDVAGWKEIRNPTSANRDLPFVKTPTVLITIIIAYLAVILGTFFWRSISVDSTKANGAKKQDPLWLRRFMLFHNVFLVGLSSFMFAGTVHQAQRYGYTFWGNMYNPEETGMAMMIYIFYLSKIYEFTDTFIMVLRGSIRQVSFLHVYHHVSISVVWWFLAYAIPGGDTYYTCALNAFIHILMYTYYLLALIFGKDTKKRKKYLWWGKHMTLLQMAQFVSMMAQALYCFFFTESPKFLAVCQFFYMQTLLILFGNFFLRKHVLKAKAKTK